jgi:hypothetical protein
MKPLNKSQLKNHNPKMSLEQAKILWNSLSYQQKFQFNEMFDKIKKGELHITEVNINNKEEIKSVVLEPINKKSKPTEPFAKHFNSKRKVDIEIK